MARRGRVGEGEHGSRHPLEFLARPFAWFCLRLGLPPLFFTLLSLPLAAVAVWLLVQQHFFFAVVAVFAAAGTDAMDGAVARARDETSAAGGYLDSMLDRVVDFVVLLGIMIALGETRGWIVGSIAVFGTLTTSAAKWRYLQERPAGDLDWRDFSRTDRYVVILAGLLVAGLFPDARATALFVLIGILAVGSTLSALVNVVRGWRSLG